MSSEAEGLLHPKETDLKEEIPPPFDLHKLREMLPERARTLETNGSFYGGTLEREWVYRKLCELGFLTSDVRNRIEEKMRAFQQGKETFFFEEEFQKCTLEEQKYIRSLSRGLFLTEAGIISEGELKELEESLRSGEEGTAFLSQKQGAAEISLSEVFSELPLYAESEREKFVPLHLAFQLLLRHRVVREGDEERYFSACFGRLLFRRDKRFDIPSPTHFARWDLLLASLNVIRRACVLGIITSKAHFDALIEGLRRQ